LLSTARWERNEEISASPFGGVSLVVEEDELADPADVGLFGAEAVVFLAKDRSDLIEKFWLVHTVLPNV